MDAECFGVWNRVNHNFFALGCSPEVGIFRPSNAKRDRPMTHRTSRRQLDADESAAEGNSSNTSAPRARERVQHKITHRG